MSVDGKGSADLDWLLNDLVDRLTGATVAALLSADGLLMNRTRSLARDEGDQLAAMASAFHSLAKSAGQQFGGGRARQTIVEMETSYLVVTAAGSGACLALLATADVDLGLAAYEMNVMVQKVGTYLGSAPRSAVDGARP